MKVFVTGTAGFIGYHLAQRLLAEGHLVTGYDGLTDYYDPALKQARLDRLRRHNGFTDIRGMLEDGELLGRSIEGFAPDVIVHLAAQAGVRYSLEHPETYVQSNFDGTFQLLEAAKAARPRHLLVASPARSMAATVRCRSARRTPPTGRCRSMRRPRRPARR